MRSDPRISLGAGTILLIVLGTVAITAVWQFALHVDANIAWVIPLVVAIPAILVGKSLYRRRVNKRDR